MLCEYLRPLPWWHDGKALAQASSCSALSSSHCTPVRTSARFCLLVHTLRVASACELDVTMRGSVGRLYAHQLGSQLYEVGTSSPLTLVSPARFLALCMTPPPPPPPAYPQLPRGRGGLTGAHFTWAMRTSPDPGPPDQLGPLLGAPPLTTWPGLHRAAFSVPLCVSNGSGKTK